MKRNSILLILASLLCLGVNTAEAQWITIKMDSGVKNNYKLDEIATLTHNNDNLSVNLITGENEIYPTSDIAKIEYPAIDPDLPEISLSIRVFLEGMWDGSKMIKCKGLRFNNLEDMFSGNVFDTLTVELHDGGDYSKVVFVANGLNVSQDGKIFTPGKTFISLPGNLKGEYRITVKHRNHIETTSSEALSFASGNQSIDFTISPDQTFGRNAASVNGSNVLFSGDIVGNTDSQDGVVDGYDAIQISNKITSFESGYNKEDVNGDGVTDGLDAIIVNNNIVKFVSAVRP
jgi:hypothetical protein